MKKIKCNFLLSEPENIEKNKEGNAKYSQSHNPEITTIHLFLNFLIISLCAI